MNALYITISPASKAGRFDAYLGKRWLCASKTPFLTAARVLQREGVAADQRIIMRHLGSEVDALASTVGQAAALGVGEGDRPPFFRKLTGGFHGAEREAS